MKALIELTAITALLISAPALALQSLVLILV